VSIGAQSTTLRTASTESYLVDKCMMGIDCAANARSWSAGMHMIYVGCMRVTQLGLMNDTAAHAKALVMHTLICCQLAHAHSASDVLPIVPTLLYSTTVDQKHHQQTHRHSVAESAHTIWIEDVHLISMLQLYMLCEPVQGLLMNH
jgi:hypothetical protein